MTTADTDGRAELDGTSSAFADPDFREQLRELPPSAKLVAKVLENKPALSQGDIAAATLLPDRTVRYALNRLDESGLVDSRHSFKDARKQVYYLVDR